MVDFTGFFSSIIESVQTGINNHSNTFGEAKVGRVDFNRVSYPSVHIIPDISNHTEGGEYEDVVTLMFYFERGINTTEYLSNLKTMEEAVDDAVNELENNSLVGNWVLDRVENLTGDTGSTQLEVIKAEIKIKKLIEI